MKTYTSFDEINRELRVLKLQRDISREEIKLNYQELKDDLNFVTFLGKTAGAILKRAAALKVIKKFFR